jgi:hypothetical protein
MSPVLARLSAKIAPLVQNELAGTLIAELERHFNEQLLSELQQQVGAIFDRELPKRVEAMVGLKPPEFQQVSTNGPAPGRVGADEVIACIEMILGRTPDPALVEYHLKLGFADRFALGDYMISTDEFRSRFYRKTWHRSGAAQPALIAFATAGSFDIQRHSLELMRLLKPHRAEGFQKARFGSPNDGGYVLIDDFDSIDAAFSFGIEQDASWDVSVADRGVPVYQFDHTIDASPVSRDDLIFAKKRIVAQPAAGCETINDLVDRHGSAGSASLILKIDIEHDEWPVFDATSEAALSCFAQIVGEFHGFGSMIDAPWNHRARRVFEKITGQFGVVHVHANNHCGLNSVANIPVPEVLEITFANRSRYRLVSADEIFPGPLDAPNYPYLPDIHLGKFVY